MYRTILSRLCNKSGTIVGCKLSLGYDVHHEQVTGILLGAASSAGLKDAFVQVTDLGDFSISYRIAGLLEDVQSLISARSDLRKSVLDALHGAGIEIVSPNFMNTLALEKGQRFMPEAAKTRRASGEQKS